MLGLIAFGYMLCPLSSALSSHLTACRVVGSTVAVADLEVLAMWLVFEDLTVVFHEDVERLQLDLASMLPFVLVDDLESLEPWEKEALCRIV